ncbi:MAG: single-stranded-DNA-specific exonuclease RecJ [Planctomycetota bacterium]|nr:single-stranded-DNA-specific exonuclease RecJ [Planctomycetota bacterium]
MRGLTRRWVLAAAAGEAPAELASLHLPPLLERILLSRGLTDPRAVQHFCEPRLTDLHDPSLMPNLDLAVERLIDAVRGDRSIVIYGDYDVDGIAATSILFHVIKAVAPEADVRRYVPHRLEEGYGLNAEALKKIRAGGTDLVITVDCGVTAPAEAQLAREIGLELIITDHHHLPNGEDKLPEALIVHPRLPGSEYPFGDLCGAGVAFKLAWRFATAWCGSQRVSECLQKILLEMLPLAALGTIADVVPLVGENRVITSFGLRLIKQTSLPGLRALIEASDLMGGNIDSEKVGFILAPRLNACGRMGHAAEAVRLLTDAAPEEAAPIARRLAQLNRQRQRTERTIFEQAARRAEDAGMTGGNKRAIVLADTAWHPGVVGIVCSRLVDRFGRPAVLMQRHGELCKGSARSIDGYSIHEGLLACAEHLTTFGGHDMAAGLTLPADRLHAFAEALIAHANERITVEQLTPELRIDCDASLLELDFPTVKRIIALSPFGRANRRPAVRLQGATLLEAPRQIGAHGRHLSVRFRQDEGGCRRVMRGVWWGAGSRAADLAPGMHLDAVIEPKLNEFNGRVSVEAEIRDVMVKEA